MDEFVANFNLDRQEFEADFELEQPVEFDALFQINPTGASWGGITGTLANQTDLKNELDTLSGQIDSNHQAITEINTTIQGYGDIVTYNVSDFATSAQGLLADTALQPNDNISELTNDVGYITSASLPIVNNGILTIQKNGSDVAVFSANQSGNQTANIIVPTDTSDLTNSAGFTTNIGTVTSVNNVSPDSEGNVTLSIPAAQVNSDWNASSGVAEILNKPNLATVATTGSYTDLSNKPTINDLTTTAQQNALNSGATSTNIGQITTNANDISDIQDLIPTQATSSNQLADKAFVNSSIATNTANFIGTFNSVAELEAYSGTLTNNDYAFVVGTDSDGNTVYDRYKYTDATNPPSWEFEYELNNSSFTAAQWDAINSGITSGDVTLIGTALQPNDNISELTNNAGYITGINSTDVTTALGYTPVNPSSLATVATSGDYDDLIDKPTIPTDTTDLTNGAGYITSSALTDYVTTNTTQNITGTKTFVGQKKVGFKQSSSSDKLGFTLYNNSGTEKGYLEFNPSNTVDSVPLMTLGNYASASAGLTHVGFRKYDGSSSGAYNLLAPLISDAKTPFSLTTTYTNFYLPLGFTDGTTTIKTAKSGVVDLSSLDFISSSSLSTTLANYVLSSSLATVATSGSYNDLTDKPTIPTVNDGTITINQGGIQKGTFTLNQSGNTTIDLDAGGGGDLSNYYTKTETNSLLDTKQDILGAQSPLVISADPAVTTTSNITYDATTGSLVTNFTSANEEGSITFTIPSDVNINVLNDYWRIGTKTQDLQCLKYDRGQNNGNVFVAIDEDDNVVSRVWYGSGDYRKGDTASSASYFRYSDKDIMHHVANEQATYQGTGSDNFSSGFTLQSKRLKAFILYYVSVQSYTNLGSGITNYNDYQHLTDIRLFTSASDTEGILLNGDGGLSVKLNVGTGLAVQSNSLVSLGYTQAETDSLIASKQDALTAGDGITITGGSGTLPNNFTGSSALITCDSSESGYPAYYAFDGNSSTYWGGQNTGQHWIKRQHDSIIVKSVSVSFREYSERFTQGELQGSNDGSNFTTLVSFSNNEDTSITLDCSSNTTAYTYTRLVGTTTSSGWGKVGEMVINYESPAVIAVGSKVLQNPSTAENTLTIDTTANANKWAVNIGKYSQAYIGSVAIGSASSSSNACKATGDGAVAVGFQAQATATTSTAIGVDTKATALGAIQIGKGTNSTANTLYIGFNNSGVTANYELLTGSTGLIPDARISSNIARTSAITNMQTTTNLVTSISSSSTDAQYPSAKCVYNELQTVKRNIGEIVQSTIPLSDAGLHLLDGSLLSYGSYQAFIDYIGTVYNNAPISNNVQIVGGVTSNNGVLSNFSNDNYATFTNSNPIAIDPFEFVIKFKPDNFTNLQAILQLVHNGYSDVTFGITQQKHLTLNFTGYPALTGTTTLSSQYYYAKIVYDTDTTPVINVYLSTTGEFAGEEILDISGGSIGSFPLFETIDIGRRVGTDTYFRGEIDLKECYIKANNSMWWTGILKGAFTDEASWQQSVTDYGVCGKFVYDSVNNTVRLPKITGFTEGTIDATVLGDLIEAGLPNITGSFQSIDYDFTSSNSGAFSGTWSSGNRGTSSSGSLGTSVRTFNASRSSSIYGNSNTVQPQAIEILYYIVIANATKTEIQVDIDEIVTDLNGKADADLSNLTSGLSNTICTTKPTTTSTATSQTPAVVIENYLNGSSWYRVWSDGWCEQGGVASGGTNTTGSAVAFIKTFANTDYTLVTGGVSRQSEVFANNGVISVKIRNISVSGFYATTSWVTASSAGYSDYDFSWYACGYIS